MRCVLAVLGVLALLLPLSPSALAEELPQHPNKIPAVSGGFENHKRAATAPEYVGPSADSKAPIFPGAGFDAYNFDDNPALTGFLFIPPDPIGAAGIG